ncbi:esterase [Solirubrobacter sp. CPCC 204708]|uniref:Alpha/beta hydrolase-fold protein n=1 Tax=Solirubrobacter deserti TaxID=2282478 RepID=A0ABT4RBM7_9ACTN|nr:alpha/beta hydrolase-fold protein [Solirubrobacter deserti]MBE2317180.1 esterase [Solirubrobacter deserti]MDA0135927.1 alpha/beta hydrolase-fold protein [Solirubrobacter deserti]
MGEVLRLEDPDGAYSAVRLSSDLHLTDEQRTFTRDGEAWVLDVELADVQRLEYKLEVDHAGGGTEHILDPGTEKRAPGAFGDKSVLERAGYEAPAWLEAEPAPGRYDDAEVRGRGLGSNVAVRVWSPEEYPPGTPARLLLANDGPEYDQLSRLTHYAGVMQAKGTLPPFRVALLQPGDRDNWYSASAVYSRVLDGDILPQLRGAFGLIGAPVGMGASLGALAMLAAQRRFPRAFAGLFLQSGSYFMPRYDRHESGFSRYTRITRFVRDTGRGGEYAFPVPVTLTVGAAEENADNNRAMARALEEQGYEVSLVEVPDMHNYVGWRDAFDPHLTELLKRAWTPR